MTNAIALRCTKKVIVSALMFINITAFTGPSLAHTDEHSKRISPILSYLMSLEDTVSNLNITHPYFFSNNSGDCTDYVQFYQASVSDIQNQTDYTMEVTISHTDSHCTLVTNTIPNHDFNATGSFATVAAEIARTYTIPILPEHDNPADPTENSTALDQIFNAVFLNGVPLDIPSAGCYDPQRSNSDDGLVRSGCRPADYDWMLDPLFAGSSFGTDEHNAHTQPDGTYHYHGNPNALFEGNDFQSTPNVASPVIAFAADGFPVYGAYINDNGEIRKVRSGYQLKEGSRGTRTSTNPGGEYDGTYVADWEFTDNGDLDKCNGMTVNGQYGYYVTDSFPWVMACYSGTPDESFRKSNSRN